MSGGPATGWGDDELLRSTRLPTQPEGHYCVHVTYDSGAYIVFWLLTEFRAYRRWADEYGVRFLAGARVVTTERIK